MYAFTVYYCSTAPHIGKHATDIIRTASTFSILLLSTSTILHSCDHPTDDMETEPSAAHVFHTKIKYILDHIWVPCYVPNKRGAQDYCKYLD